MNTTKLSFVVLLEFVNITLEDINTFGLKIIENETDIELGYFTVEGENKLIKEFRSFLYGGNLI